MEQVNLVFARALSPADFCLMSPDLTIKSGFSSCVWLAVSLIL